MRNGQTFMVAALVSWAVWAHVHAQGPKPSEFQVKAAFLYNFANFVEWPPAAFADSTSPFVIGVLGEDPFGDELAQIVRGESVGKHKIQIKHWKTPEELGICHILYTQEDNNPRLSAILGKTKGLSVLTVGEASDFAADGGVIEFVSQDNRVRFQVNTSAAGAAHLNISSKLLKVASKIVAK